MLNTEGWLFRPSRDALRKHWEWLRKWLLLSWKTNLVLLIALIVLIKLISYETDKTSAVTAKVGPISLAVKVPVTKQVPSSESVDSGNTILAWQRPCSGQVVSRFGMGWSEEYQDYRYQDFVLVKAQGEKVKALSHGRVRRVLEKANEYTLVVQTPKGLLWELSGVHRVDVGEGQKLEAGELLGQVVKGQMIKVKLESAGKTIDPEKYIKLE